MTITEADEAAAQLWRLAQAQELIWAGKNQREPSYDRDGRVIPSKAALEATEKEHPDLVAKAG